jgi:hypothetical protein
MKNLTISALIVSLLLVATAPAQAAPKPGQKGFYNSCKKSAATRKAYPRQCNIVLNAETNANATINNAKAGMMAPPDLRPTCYGNMTEYRDNCSPRSY